MMADEQSNSSTPSQLDTLAGASLGLLVGLTLGLSTSGIVASTAATFVAIATAFLGLGGDILPKVFVASSKRLLAFAIATSLAMVGSIWVRSHDVLSPSFKSQYDELYAAHFTEAEAKGLLKYSRFGLVPEGEDAVAALNDIQKGKLTILYSGASDYCTKLEQDRGASAKVRLGRIATYRIVPENVRSELSKQTDDVLKARLDALAVAFCGS